MSDKTEQLKEYLKQGLMVAAVLGSLYGFFLAPIGGKSISGHLVDVWRSPTMQSKLDLFGDQVTALFKDEINMVENAKARVAKSLVKDNIHGQISDKDRKELDSLIDQVVD
jgi:hypothetical protein